MHSNLIKFYDQLSVIIQQNPDSSEIPLLVSLHQTCKILNSYKKYHVNIHSHLEMLVDFTAYFVDQIETLSGVGKLLIIINDLRCKLEKIETAFKEVI